MTKILKTIIAFLLLVIVFLLWTGLDASEYEEDENIVTIEYECDRLAEYEKVPTVVIKECFERSKK